MSRGLNVPLSSANCCSCNFFKSLSLPGTSIPLWMMWFICRGTNYKHQRNSIHHYIKHQRNSIYHDINSIWHYMYIIVYVGTVLIPIPWKVATKVLSVCFSRYKWPWNEATVHVGVANWGTVLLYSYYCPVYIHVNRWHTELLKTQHNTHLVDSLLDSLSWITSDKCM